MSETEPHIDEFVVHRPPMRLLDRIVSVTDTDASAELVVRSDNPFFETERGIPAYVGLEMMAQAIAVIDGAQRRNSGLPAKLGFLLGCRRYSARCESFPLGARLIVTVNKVFGEGEMLAFDCRIDDEQGEAATANIKVYAPANPQDFLSRADA
jgi:predicted hotdog family 3-hydroxylacyl-ACP dehydratase